MNGQTRKINQRLIALLLCLVMVLTMGILPGDVDAAETSTTVIACSDFQNRSGNDAGAQTVQNITTMMQNSGITSADGFLCCGDYDYDLTYKTADTEAGITALRTTVQKKYPELETNNMVFVEGNHDVAGAAGLATSGENDPASGNYGVFVINEDDYMWRNDDLTTIQNTAASLKTYLDAKRTAGFTAPIFVVSHLPLHYSMRTHNDGDGMYANYIFDVLNAAGANGLNIIFLYGHDHSNGWDDYLGGSCVYLAKGKNINIAQESKTNFQTETLNFTYMNAGFTGYYDNRNGADDTLTMTAFQIYSDRVVVSRYSAADKHNLKCKGVTNSYKNESGYAPDETVVTSPQTITLTAVEDVPALTIDGAPVSSYEVDRATNQTLTFTPINFTATSWTSSDETVATVENGVVTLLKAGTVTITATGTPAARAAGDTTSASVTLTVTDSSAEPTERTYTLVTSESELVSGDQYLLIYNGTQFVLPKIVTRSNDSGDQRTGMDLEDTSVASGGPATITGQYQAKEWQLVGSSGSWLLSNGTQQIKLTNTNNLGITATFEDVGSPFSLNFNTSHLVSFTHGSWELNYNQSRDLINGYDSSSDAARMYIYRLTDAGTVDPSGGDWVTISDGQGKTIFRLVDQLTAGKKYLIVSSNQAGSANAVNLNGTSINSEPVTIIADGGDKYIEAPANTAQWTYTNADKFQNVSSTGRYLRGGKKAGDSLNTTDDSSDSRTTWRYDSTNGLCETSKKLYISSSFKMLSPGSSSNRVYIYEEATLQTSAEYAKLTGSLEYTVAPGTSAADALAAVKAGIVVVTSSDMTNETTLPDDNANITWTLDSSYRGEAGDYAVTISYKNTVIGTAKVVVPEMTVDHIEVTPMEGTVQKGASNYAKTGSTLTVTYSDGSTRTVDVTLGMLSGNFNKNTVGDYTGLTVTYEGKTVTGYTLHVTPKSGNDYPEYPHEGAVRVGKTGEGINFQSSGIAKVELTATGVPVKKGADVIVMVDTSSSMTTTVDGSSKSRIQVLRESLTNLIRQFQAVGADGEPQDIRVAIADFNGYVTSGGDDTPYRLKSVDHLKGTTTRTGTNAAKVYTGSTQLNADAFVTAEQAASVINSIKTSSGTNYDYAFDATYQLGEAILAQNAQDGEERDLFVIFMSDGAPFQYNYFSSGSDAANWNNWLQGTYASASDVPSDSEHKYFYNGSGNKHRMAEAIKGNPDEMYTVIRKDSTDHYDGQQYMTQLPGLGATMYSIGFCLEQDNQITVASMEYVLKNISSDPTKFYYKVNTADELSSAFTAIGNEIAYAATNARFVDTMGADYNLQMKSSTYKLSDGTIHTITPKITVQAYDIYTAADGVAPSEIGKRKGTSTVLETVTFNEGGTEAYSDKKSGNILVNGVICANTFWYNTNTTGSAVSIDTNGDGTNDYDLAPETFYWKTGTINQTELALSYYVYLTGSMEGTRGAGSYPTNESATLYYTNWLGNEAKKDTVSPVLAWKSAHVSYAFYLVNDMGEIIVNQSTGATGSFANKIALTNPVVAQEVLLNSGANVNASVVAQNVLPTGYTLYDPEAAYTVQINSNSTGRWSVTRGDGVTPDTTYVTEYGGEPTTATTESNNSYDYTHTVVWFAVKYEVKCMPDTVVIDYGLPVDIHVLKNDMFYGKGALQYIGAVKTDGSATGDAASAFKTTDYAGRYGTAKVITNVQSPEESVVRYTPNTMQMSKTDQFSYAVAYSGTPNDGYYYGTVTVIPATTIYYEDSFVTFEDGSQDGETTMQWTQEGTTTEATQAEDRPGQFSLSSIDANNVYGYDQAYRNCSQYSLGSAMKVTLNMATSDNVVWPTAQFTFCGTGFDLISVTSGETGTIRVRVYKGTSTAKADKVKDWTVDTYYGYEYQDDAWVVTDKSDTLYQIPVIKGEGLEYGTYTVVVTPYYYSAFDHTGGNDASYDFYLDAIRIYDPAGKTPTNPDISNAYKADQEYAPDYAELRNLLIQAGDFDATTEAKNGIVFVDGYGETGNMEEYTAAGPNNEVYLKPGQAIAFDIWATEKPDSVQLGMKLVQGKSATVNVGNSNATDSVSQVITTATDLYYTITQPIVWSAARSEDGFYKTKYPIVITNASDSDAIVSLTNVKWTFSESGEGNGPTGTQNTVKLMSTAATAPAAYHAVRSVLGIVDEPEVFQPEQMELNWKQSSVTTGRKATLTITTSSDVTAITVNGEALNQGKLNRRTGLVTWTYTVTAGDPGVYTYEVVASNADGLTSEPMETQLSVTPRKTLAEWFDALFDWIWRL